LHESGEFLGLRLFFFPLRGHLRLAAEHFSFQRSTRIWSRVLSLFSTNQTVAFLSLAFSLSKNCPPVDGFPVPSSGPSSGLDVVGFVVGLPIPPEGLDVVGFVVGLPIPSEGLDVVGFVVGLPISSEGLDVVGFVVGLGLGVGGLVTGLDQQVQHPHLGPPQPHH